MTSWPYQPLLPAAAQQQAGPTVFTLTADVGGFTLSGQAAGLLVAHALAAEQGAFVLSGEAAGFVTGRAIAAAVGSLALSGQAAGLTAGRLLGAGEGAFALSGQAAGLNSGVSLSLLANAGSLTLSGQAAAFDLSRRFSALYGGFRQFRPAASLRKACVASAASTTPLAIQKGWMRNVERALANAGLPDVRVYDDAPPNAAFPFVSMDLHQWLPVDGSDLYGFDHRFYASIWSNHRGRREVLEILEALWIGLHDQTLIIDEGVHVLCQVIEQRAERDQDGRTYQGSIVCRIFSNLTWTPFDISAPVLTAEQGGLALTGAAAQFAASRLLTAEQGGFALTGVDASLSAGTAFILAGQGGLALTGIDAALVKSNILAAEQGGFTLTGVAVSLAVSHSLAAGQGGIALTGIDAAFVLDEPVLVWGTGNPITWGSGNNLKWGA